MVFLQTGSDHPKNEFWKNRTYIWDLRPEHRTKAMNKPNRNKCGDTENWLVIKREEEDWGGQNR